MSHCTALRRLRLSTHSINCSLSPLWKSLGSSLRHLEVDALVKWHPKCEFRVLGAECKNLRVFWLRGIGTIEPDSNVWDFFEHHGSRLEVVGLGDRIGMDAEQLSAVRVACPNAAIDARSSYVDFASMVAMGASASHLYVGNLNGTLRNIGGIGNACPNLSSCHFSVGDIPLADVRALLELRKHNLERVEVALRWDGPTTETILQGLSERVSSLKELKCNGPVPPALIWKQLVAANPRLCKVRLRFQAGELCEFGRLCDIDWRPFVTPLLEKDIPLEADFACEISDGKPYGPFCYERADMCLRARAKSISVCMCGYQYL